MIEAGQVLDSGFIMYPSGHARNTSCNLENILDNKFRILGKLALSENDIDRFLIIFNYF